MSIYKQSIDFLPKPSIEEVEEKYKVSKAALYAAVLPLLASLIWVIAMLINVYYKGEVKALDNTIADREAEIETFDLIRTKQSELVLKVEALKDIVIRDFYPQKFFDEVENTIKTTGGAQAGIYAYGRKRGWSLYHPGKS